VQRIRFRTDDCVDGSGGDATGAGEWTTDPPPISPNYEEYGFLDITQATFPQSGLPGAAVPFKVLSRTILHVQFELNIGVVPPNIGNDQIGDVVECDVSGLEAPNSLKTLIRRSRTRTNEASRFLTVWAMEWDPPANAKILTDMRVQHIRRYFDELTSATEQIDFSTTTPNPWVPTIVTPAVLAQTSLDGFCASSDGTGVGTPRGFDVVRLVPP